MPTSALITATISAATKEQIDHFCKEYGFTLDFVMEQALLLFLDSDGQLASEAPSPTRLDQTNSPEE